MIKKIISLVLIMATLVTVGVNAVSCGSEGQSTSTSTTAGKDDTLPNEGEKTLKAELTVNGNPLSDYKIIYARAEYADDGAKFTTEWDFYKLVAREIRSEIKNITGLTLDIAEDSTASPTAKEILVGPTNRPESDAYDDLDVYTYKNFVKNGKLVLGAGYNSTYLTAGRKTNYCWAATSHCFDYFKDYLKAQLEQGGEKIDLKDGLDITGKCELTTIVCIGDSITEGAQASDRTKTSWPSVLQRILWKDYVVSNLGYSTKAVRSDLDTKYKGTVCYDALGVYGKEFDIALFMMGTNDSYADPNFSASEDKIFKDSAIDIINKMGNKDVKVTVMNCPAYYGTGTFGSLHVRQLQRQLVTDLRDKGYETEFFDMNTFTKEHLGASCFPDELHPGDKGYSIIAQRMAELVPLVLEGRWDSNTQAERIK